MPREEMTHWHAACDMRGSTDDNTQSIAPNAKFKMQMLYPPRNKRAMGIHSNHIKKKGMSIETRNANHLHGPL